MSEAVVMMAMGGGVLSISACLASILLVILINKDKESSTHPADVESTIPDGSVFTISRDGSYIAQDFDSSREKGAMCDAASVSSRDQAATFKFTRQGKTWTVATDCDGDGKWTSYMTGTQDLIAARDKKTPNTQQWTIECTSPKDDASIRTCSFKNIHTSSYLTGSNWKSPTYTEVYDQRGLYKIAA